MLVVACKTNIRELQRDVWCTNISYVIINLHKIAQCQRHVRCSEDYLNKVAWASRDPNHLALLSVGQRHLDVPQLLTRSQKVLTKQRNTDLVARIVSAVSCRWRGIIIRAEGRNDDLSVNPELCVLAQLYYHDHSLMKCLKCCSIYGDRQSHSLLHHNLKWLEFLHLGSCSNLT